MAAPKRKLLSGLLLIAISLVGAALFRRQRVRRGEQVDLYFADGSLSSLPAGAAAGDAILGIARDLLKEARA